MPIRYVVVEGQSSPLLYEADATQFAFNLKNADPSSIVKCGIEVGDFGAFWVPAEIFVGISVGTFINRFRKVSIS